MAPCRENFEGALLSGNKFRYSDHHTLDLWTVFNHINAAHFKTVYFQCKGEDCTFRTFWRSHLVRHFRRVHKGGEGELSARDIMESQVIGSHVDLHLFSHNKFSATRENRLPKTVMVEDYPSFRFGHNILTLLNSRADKIF